MADIKLFNIKGEVKEYQSGTVTLEKELQTVIEQNMDTFFGVTFLASEYSTTDGGRMDSLGIDENHCPVIFEYKRSIKENVINQGLFYLNWLLDHKDSFNVLVIKKLGLEAMDTIDWTMPRVVCIAGDFTKYDASAIKQMNRNISLIRYRKFGSDLLMFEQINENIAAAITEDNGASNKQKTAQKTFADKKKDAAPAIQALYDDVKNYVLSLGDDVTETQLKYYVAFKKIKNIVCAEIHTNHLTLYLKLDAGTVDYEDGFTRDATQIGHLGTGNVEVTIHTRADYEKALLLLDRAYEEN